MKPVPIAVSLAVILGSSVAFAQGQSQVTVTAPQTAVSSEFVEQIGVGLQLSHPGFFVRFGGPRAMGAGGGFAPQLGGSTFFFPLRGGGLNADLSIFAGQSSSRGLTTTAPMLTTLDGAPGFMFSGTVQPFITGLFPVVGSGGRSMGRIEPAPAISPIQSMMMRGDLKIEQDSNGRKRLVTPNSGTSRTAPAATAKKSDTSNPFRQGMEKYAGSKR